MDCEKFSEQISLYIDGELNEDEKKRFENHLKTCESCQKEYDEILKVVNLCRDLEELKPPKTLRSNIIENLKEIENQSVAKNKKVFSLKNNLSKNWKAFAGIAAVIFFIIVTYSVVNIPMTPFMGATREEQSVEIAGSPDLAGTQEEALKTKREITDTNFNASTKDFVQESQEQQPPQFARKIIKNADINITVEDFEDVFKQITEMTNNMGGYIKDSRVSKSEQQIFGTVIVRVPSKVFEAYISKIEELGEITHKSISGNDITSQYLDTEARVKNLKRQENRLLEILDKAKTVEEILKIENELNRIRYEIERLTGQLKQWDNLVELSTVNIHLKQSITSQERITPFSFKKAFEGMVRGFIKTVNSILVLISRAIVLFGSVLPILIILGVLGSLGVLILKRKR